MKDKELTVDDYVQGILNQNRARLAQSITLIESEKPEHQKMANDVLGKILPYTGKSLRIGISGIPGVGKSTFIESFGNKILDDHSPSALASAQHHLAVLAIDPSSSLTGGSILGDKTRMNTLSYRPEAFIRPTPTRGTLGGVASKTRETIFLCEAYGMDRILIETVGVGQSETIVADMVDFFMVLLLPGAGDDLQGIKRGILEVADMIIIHKADGENKEKAKWAKMEYERALRILQGRRDDQWVTPVHLCSSLTHEGYDDINQSIKDFEELSVKTGLLKKKREEQQKKWMWNLIESQLLHHFKNSPPLKNHLKDLEQKVLQGKLPAQEAAQEALAIFFHSSDIS